MVKIQGLIIQLQDPDPNQRIQACEELGQLPSIPDHALNALRGATQDPNHEVAETAQRALSFRSSNMTADKIFPTPTASIPANRVIRNDIIQIFPWMAIAISLVFRYWRDITSFIFAPTIFGYIELAFLGGIFFFLAASGVLLFYYRPDGNKR
jgi:hypothetical protein